MSTSDRELLELAAMAVGIDLGWENEIPYTGMGSYMPAHWNPLTDDGDALRLAVKLKLDIEFYNGAREVVVSDYEVDFIASADYEDDMNAATRRAIVRAAAEIGRSME